MIAFERRQRLLSFLREHPGLRVPALARRLGVSEGTIRNDLKSLVDAGEITRVRGGAVVKEGRPYVNPAFAARVQVDAEAKRRIARRAAEMVDDGDSLLLDASTTVFAMAPHLLQRHNLTVITNGIEVGRALAQNPSHAVILIGGVIRPDGTSVVGPLGEKILDDLHVKTAFVSASGFSLEAGLTEVDFQEVYLKRKMIKSAGRVVALVDAHKFGRKDLTPFAGLEQLSYVITDREPSSEYVQQLCLTATQLVVCGGLCDSDPYPCDELRDA